MNIRTTLLLLSLLSPAAWAQTDAWQSCTGLRDANVRLACFDAWATQQAEATATPHPSQIPPQTLPAQPVPSPADAPVAVAESDCRNPARSDLSRFWELESGSDCGTFAIRGYKPISLSWIGSDSVNTQPSSPSPDHTASTSLPYGSNEARIQLSVRTKIAQGLLTQGEPSKRDSIWFGYTQQSYWQLFNPGLSRPFRATDHEPEILYIYPTDVALPGGWRWRYAGWALNHQSNGQSLPLSRSWNRNILMAGFERGDNLRVMARAWYRVPEAAEDDDNPDISNRIGRAEVTAQWNPDRRNTLGLTVRHSLRAQANGSVRLEWLRSLADDAATPGRSGLRFHTQLFSGYGDSLIDYNHRRTVLSVGLSLVDW